MPDDALTTADWFLTLFEDAATLQRWLAGVGVRDTERGARDLRDLARRAGRPELLALVAGQLNALLPRCPDAGMALANLERFVAASRRPAAVLRDLTAHPRTTEVLVQLFSTSQYFSEQLIREPT